MKLLVQGRGTIMLILTFDFGFASEAYASKIKRKLFML